MAEADARGLPVEINVLTFEVLNNEELRNYARIILWIKSGDAPVMPNA